MSHRISSEIPAEISYSEISTDSSRDFCRNWELFKNSFGYSSVYFLINSYRIFPKRPHEVLPIYFCQKKIHWEIPTEAFLGICLAIHFKTFHKFLKESLHRCFLDNFSEIISKHLWILLGILSEKKFWILIEGFFRNGSKNILRDFSQRFHQISLDICVEISVGCLREFHCDFLKYSFRDFNENWTINFRSKTFMNSFLNFSFQCRTL